MRIYTVTYWTGRVETVHAASARDAALTIWSEDHLHRYSVDPELLDRIDTMVILSENYDHVASIVPTLPAYATLPAYDAAGRYPATVGHVQRESVVTETDAGYAETDAGYAREPFTVHTVRGSRRATARRLQAPVRRPAWVRRQVRNDLGALVRQLSVTL